MEELDLEAKNLCTTEDAFEQFQSGAMYEEDEFITLSDIVSSPQTNQDVNEILHDDPCDEVSLSIQDDETVNNINIPPFKQNEVLNIHSQSKEQNNKNKTSTSKRRGRKKKGTLENSDVPQIQYQSDLNKPTKPKRKSRKSFIEKDTSSELKNVEESIIEEPKGATLVIAKINKPANKAKRKSNNSVSQKEIKQQVKKQRKQAKQTTKKIQKETLNEEQNRQVNISTIEDSNISTPPVDIPKHKQKRGRKKQNISCQNAVSIDTKIPSKINSVISSKKENNELQNSIPKVPLYDETNKSLEVDDKPDFTNKEKLKNSVSESVENYISEEDIEDLPLSNLSRKTENELNTTLEKNITELNIHSKNKTTNCKEIIVKKRGRPKKINDKTPAKTDLEVKKVLSENTREHTEKYDNINDLNTQEEQNTLTISPEKKPDPVIPLNSETQVLEVCEKINVSTESNSQSKRNSKKKIIPDFEYNVDSVVKNDNTEDTQKSHEDNESIVTDDPSRRPVRRRVLKNWNYDEGSDEDPYANVESSDDEPRRRKKGGRYYSDDEYFPGNKRQLTESESDIVMEEDDIDVDNRPQKKKKSRRSDLTISIKSPRKKGRKSDAESICTTEKTNTNTDSGDVDFDDCLDSSTIRGNDEQITPTKSKRDRQPWGKRNEFDNFIAKIVQGTDIKISKKSVDNVKTPLQIPVIEATEAKKTIEKSAQTITVNTKPACVQTDTVYEIPMKDQVPLTGDQSEKACDFLSSIVQTTAELGQLMTQKSEDFITKKINTKYVTDTFKMDYCVKKSFLLFKLAKHNLVQMEEDLSKQYEGFLKENNLIQHRHEQKVIASTSKASDSDCEIVEEPVKNKAPPKVQKPAFNPKTVFLNKELSIKIAKKPTEEPAPKKKLNIKGKHSVWINDSVLVKKVKPNQSFLAQDSRNKKPPDSKITLEQVNDFFKMYERQKALFICAPFVRTEWFGRERKYMCNYFVDSTSDFPEKTVVMQNETVVSEVAFVEHDSSHVIGRPKQEESIELRPQTLSLLCTKIVQNCLRPKEVSTCDISKQSDPHQYEDEKTHSQSLINAVDETHLVISDINKNIIRLKPNYNALSLKTLCFKRVINLMSSEHFSDIKPKLTSDNGNRRAAGFYKTEMNNNMIKVKKNTLNNKQIKPLLSLCLKVIQETQKANLSRNINNIKNMPQFLKSLSLFKVQTLVNGNSIKKNAGLEQKFYNVKNLLQLCLDATNTSLRGRNILNNTSLDGKCYNVKTLLQLCIDATDITLYPNSITNDTSIEQKKNNVKTLLQLCMDATNISLYFYNKSNTIDGETLVLEPKNSKVHSVMTLKLICFNKINELGTEWYTRQNTLQEIKSDKTTLNFTIDYVNTVSDDVFLDAASDDHLDDSDNDSYFKSSYKNEEEQQNYSDVNCEINYEDNGEYDNNWVSQVQMQELRSCFDTPNIEIEDTISGINENIGRDSIVQIKLEPDDYSENECVVNSSNIKIEPIDENEYTEESHNYSSINIITKQEDIVEAQVRKEPIRRQSSNSCDEQHFETFVCTNKMITTLDDYGGTSDEIFSQSSQRVRRQYEPDSVDEIDVLTDSMNLLVPQNVDSNDRLTESSEEEGKEEYKKSDKKKSEKRKGKLKKNNKDLPNKGKALLKNELTLKGKIKDKIRQDQNKPESSNSEPDCLKLNVPINNEKITEKQYKDESHTKIIEKEEEKVIQCSEVDSTELIAENKSNLTLHENKGYEESDDNYENFDDERSFSPLIDSNEPIEVLECEPTLPIFDNFFKKKPKHRIIKKKIVTSAGTSYVDRHGWKCYPINRKDNKIHANPHIQLDKLPESLIETYFKYQEVIDETTKELEVDKSTNLQPLQSTTPTEVNNLNDSEPKITDKITKVPDTSEIIESNENKLKKENLVDLSPSEDIYTSNENQLKKENLEDLYPSEDKYISNENELKKENLEVLSTSEDNCTSNNNKLKNEILDEFSTTEDKSTSNIDEYIPPTPVQSSEIDCIKKSLMNDESDTEKADVGTESTIIKVEKTEEQIYRTRSGRTVKCKIENAELWKDDLMLTADRMMNKELSMLHAPVDLKQEEEDTKDLINKTHSKNAQRNASKGHTTRYQIKTEDDSSSEEEKQWFTTKEKLLKRLLKKNEDTKVDDAKRAKIVSEFIEKRGGLPEPRQRARARPRCSKKSIMERRKQIKILSRELFGVDTVYSKKYSQASTSKGRRNIRKVIDKKSLACSTVIANMEEFERKRRLTIRQAQLREELGCEEGVNVVVINDELCLEYDFEKKRPVVSVHQFFTKVMKAHQYEGVKFMWDACFESVSLMEGGGAGGGCILAHCMGLGKTLQVLALLHTVLTHPQVGMRRVLVCCPLSTVLNWVDEIHKWIGPVTDSIKVFELSKLKKTYERAYQLEDWYNGGGIFIIGYELFRSLSTLDPVLDCVRPTIVNKIRTALLDPGPDIIVCDEGHLLKNDCSVLALAMSRVATKRRIMLTGTPMQNNLREYYCMVNFVKPNLLGSYSEYSNRFENPIMNGQHRDSREEDIKLMKARTHILHKVLEGCLQRQEASVLYPYLPKKYEYTVFISLTKCQWELYKHYLTHHINTKENKQSVLRDFHVLQKIWTHPLVLNNFLMKTRDDEKEPKTKAEKLDDELEEAPEHAAPSAAAWWAGTDHHHVLHQLDSSYKFLVVFRLLHECVELGDKVLIFSTSLYAMDALEFFLKRENKWTLGREYYRLDGSVPAEVRQKWCREFNAPQNSGTKLFLISTRAGSLGLNMTAANRVIILDTSWNPAHDIQSIFRVYRFGQKKDCYIYRLVAMGTMEQKIYERSVTKQAVSCRVVDEQQIDRHYNLAELSELYRLDEAGSGVSAGLAAGVRDAALLRVAAGGEGLHAVHEHDSLLRGSSETVLPEHERNAAWMQFQQEHATTHIRNFEINVPKQSAEDTKVHPKTEKIEPEKDKESETNPIVTTSKIKKKQKRKSKNKTIKPEPQPSTSHQDLEPVLEENMIKKIMNILIKHNFHTIKSPDEISTLVMNVRDVVAKASKRGLNDVDPLTASIAKVLLEGEIITCPENNTKESNSIDESEDIMEMDLKERKRRRNRRDSDEEYLPDTRKRKSTTKTNTRKSNESVNSDNNCGALDSESTVTGTESTVTGTESTVTTIKSTVTSTESTVTDIKSTVTGTDSTVTGTEGTAIIAKKEISEKGSLVITIKKSKLISKKSPEIDQIVKMYEKTSKNKNFKTAKRDEPIENQSSNINETVENEIVENETVENETVENEALDECIEVDNCDTDNLIEEAPVDPVAPVSPIRPAEEESICLSDDDEPIITEPDSQNKPEIIVVDEMKDYPIPLHKSLLTNKNFIKLVAHTYLSGNPMLDEDAAVLAAQYSTLKALKEVQATGKNVTSGPIHDIAMKVLGRDLMKRLYVANPNKYAAETMVLETENLQNKTMNDIVLENTKQVEKLQKPASTEVNKKPDTKTASKRKVVVARKADEGKEDAQKPSQCTSKSSGQTVPEAPNTKVVPVGIFKGPVAPASEEPSLEECILPDDDEVIISTPPPTNPTRPTLARRNSKQLIVNTVSSKEGVREQGKVHVEELVPIGSVSIVSRPPVQSKTDSIKPAKPAKASLPSTNENSSQNKNVSKSDNNATVNAKKKTTLPCYVTISLDSDDEDTPSVVSDDNLTKPVTPDSRTSIVSPLVKNSETTSSEIKDKVPVTSVKTSSPSPAVDVTKTRTYSLEQRKKQKNERNEPTVIETKCKPGDIIRINESGKVEILKRITGAELATPSYIDKPKDENRGESNLKKLNRPAVTGPSSKDILAKKVPEKPSPLKEEKRKEIPTTSKQQNDPDPLSVLKNVVQIPAFTYEKTKASKLPVEKSLQTPSPSGKEATGITKVINPKLLEVKPIVTFKNTQQIMNSNDKPKIVNTKLIPMKSISAIRTGDVPKTKEDASKEFVIDLTSSQHDQVKNTAVPEATNEVVIVGDCSEDTETTNVSSGISNPKKPTMVTVRKTLSKAAPPKPSATPKAVPSTSDSKRSSPWSDSAQSKKMKTESIKKMTLQDFNLDDFDDIIELE